jgi:ankyrin repeat protein
LAIDFLLILINDSPNRSDLFETYQKQGLSFKGCSTLIGWKPSAPSYLANFFHDLVADEETKLDLLRFLVKNGSDVNEAAGNGDTALSLAVIQRNIPLVKVLLELGANPSQSGASCPPLMSALYYYEDHNETGESNLKERVELANILLDAKAKVDVEADDNNPLSLATFLKTPSALPLIQRMIKAGADLHWRDSDGFSLLYYICQRRINANGSDKKIFLDMVELFLKNGAKTDTLRYSGYWSPLMLAADSNDSDLASLLIKYGAKKDFADADGDIAYVYAKKNNHNTIARLLDPGFAFLAKAWLLILGKFALVLLVIVDVLFTMDALPMIISSSMPNDAYTWLFSVIFAHIMTLYILLAIYGPREFLSVMKGTFSYITSAVFYLFIIPVIFYLCISLLELLSWLLPQGIINIFEIPQNVIMGATSTGGMITWYVIFLAIFLALTILYSHFTSNVGTIMQRYRQWR